LDAARFGDVEAIEDFCAIGKAGMTDDEGRSALHYAVAYDQGAAAGALLENGADVNATDAGGNTALHFAAGYGRAAAVNALLTVGADTSIQNNDGKTAKDLILEQPKNPLNAISDVLNRL
jgi:ankyrin repeat protein